MAGSTSSADIVKRLRAVLDARAGVYKELGGAKTFGDYVAGTPSREDEEILTEPVLGDLLEQVLGFPKDAYFPQFSRGGLKPDLTPMDVIAHPFVLDAKSSTQNLANHEKQIRTYIDQRHLDFGILFNLKEFRVYRRGESGHDESLSFAIKPLWEFGSGAALPVEAEVAALGEFIATFGYREMSLEQKIERIQEAESWAQRELQGDVVEVDVDFLVEQLRDLSRELTTDAGAQADDLRDHLKVNPGREAAMLGELQALAQDIEPGVGEASLPDSVDGYLAAGEGLAARVWRQYLVRVAQLTLARIVLYRAWEDVKFVDECLYDGGFGEVYERLDSSLRKVLLHAFAEGMQKYPWLYGGDNNYAWYRPRDGALIDVLYGLIPFPLGKLDADVLGGLYESYVDEIDRDRLGQFYTPRSVVKFMLEQVDFDGPDAVFKLEGDERTPRKVFDFATGSGGFVVEAARRIIDSGGLDREKPEDLLDGLAAIATGIHGCEISPFPYYLTEINLLLQVSRLLGGLALAQRDPPAFVLSAVHADTLSSRPGTDASLEGLDPADRKDDAVLGEDSHFGLVPLDAAKQAAFDRIRDDGSFDLVMGNPPYVFETNNRILFDRLRKMAAWKSIYRGKSDYLYYFLQLAIEKLAPGGRLCVITPAGWMNAGNADWLRESVAANMRLDELYLFGSYRLFAPEREARGRRHRAPTPTVESAILIATKAKPRKNHKLRVVALENEAEGGKEFGVEPEARSPDRDRLLEAMATRRRGRAGRKHGIHVHDLVQSELVSTRPWPIKHAGEDTPRRVVAHLQAALDSEETPVERLAERWSIVRGIETGADSYGGRVRSRLAAKFPRAKKELDLRGVENGDPIMELPAGVEAEKPWIDHPNTLARSIEPEAILYGAMDTSQYTSLVWLGRGDEPDSAVVKALEDWKPVLSSRAEFVRNPRRRWWETAWPRDKSEMRKAKVIALYRTDRGRFALDETGDWQPSNKTTLAIAKGDDMSPTFLCGLLNSELLDVWYVVRGKNPRDVWRNYEPKPMAEIPYRRVVVPNGADDPRLGELDGAIQAGNVETVAEVALGIAADLRADATTDGVTAAAVERLVRAIASNRQALLPYRERFPLLRRVVKDPWSIGPVEPNRPAFIAGLSAGQTVSARLDPELEISIEADGVLGKPDRDGDALILRYRTKETVRVAGSAARQDVLDEALTALPRILVEDLEQIRLPKDLDAFDAVVAEEGAMVAELLADGRLLVEAVERLVCALYDVPVELEDDVVQHALARASSGADDEE